MFNKKCYHAHTVVKTIQYEKGAKLFIDKCKKCKRIKHNLMMEGEFLNEVIPSISKKPCYEKI